MGICPSNFCVTNKSRIRVPLTEFHNPEWLYQRVAPIVWPDNHHIYNRLRMAVSFSMRRTHRNFTGRRYIGGLLTFSSRIREDVSSYGSRRNQQILRRHHSWLAMANS
jgi:hypothetical protein